MYFYLRVLWTEGMSFRGECHAAHANANANVNVRHVRWRIKTLLK